MKRRAARYLLTACALLQSGAARAQTAPVPVPPPPAEAAGPPAQAPAPPKPARALPPVREVVRLAIATSKARGPGVTRELARRARLSGLVPELRFGAERGQQQDLSLSDSGSAARTNEAQGDALKLQASLTFDLPRLVFAPEEVRLLSVERWLANDVQQLIEQVVRLYFRYRRLVQGERAGDASDAAPSEADELEALLDILTEGGFSAWRPAS